MEAVSRGDSVPPPLRAALEGVRAEADPFGSQLLYVEHTGSTNDEAARLAAAGAQEGTLVVAAAQSSGRGRQGRSWFSPPGGGLYFSLVFRPGPGEARGAALLTLTAGVAVAEAIEETTGLRAEIKWPNDLVVRDAHAPGGRGRKLAGILAESAVRDDGLAHVIVGVGINVRDATWPADLRDRVSALDRETGRPTDAAALLAACVASLARHWRDVRRGHVEGTLREWRRRSPTSEGCPVVIESAHGRALGVTCGLDTDGALLVRVGDEVRRIVAGDITWT